jgi:nicotinate-nucleotide pyrophosphorylase (carboxylating)
MHNTHQSATIPASPIQPMPAMHRIQHLQSDIIAQVRAALAEDIGTGDITAQLIPAQQSGQARIITREPMIMCGRPWVDEVMHQVDANIRVEWRVHDGDTVEGDSTLFTLHGAARSLLTAERTALNFLQLLAGSANTSPFACSSDFVTGSSTGSIA